MIANLGAAVITNAPKPTFDRTKSVGFPKSNAGASAAPGAAVADSSVKVNPTLRVGYTQPVPLKKQAKGRVFISCVLLSLLGFIAFSLWNEFGRFQAYGEIEGTVVRLSAYAPGRLTSIAVNEGDFVRAGDVLAVVDARELQMNIRRLKSDLQIALSNLRVRMAEIAERSRLTFSERIDRRVEFHRMQGELHLKQAKLQELKSDYDNKESLRSSNAVSETEFVASRSAYEGLNAEVRDLQSAVLVLEAEVNSATNDNVKELLQAEQARITEIQSELNEVESLVDASRIVAPVDGLIVKRHCQPGEFVDPKQPVVELLQAGSVEAAVYLPQHQAKLLSVGDAVQLIVTPLGERRAFRVQRISPELVPPPQSLQANYRAFKSLVCVRAVPAETNSELSQVELSRWIGAELALPRFAFHGSPDQSLLVQFGITSPGTAPFSNDATDRTTTAMREKGE